jgi:Tfp pilus assembly protein PilN
MIEINLSTVKKPLDLSDVGGLDLSKIKVKWVLLAILILYVPDLFLSSQWEDDIIAEEAKLQDLRDQKASLQRRLDSLKDFSKQTQALQRQEQSLKDKLEVVKTILTKKQNPAAILIYVAQNIPAEVWLTSININGNSAVFKGVSVDYAPQGVFQENLKQSVFFNPTMEYFKIEPDKATAEAKNLAPFEIKATVTRFE